MIGFIVSRRHEWVEGVTWVVAERSGATDGHNGSVGSGAGFQLSVEDPDGNAVGELALSDLDRTQYSSGSRQWVTHTAAGVLHSVQNWEANNSNVRYPVTWIAPDADAGRVTFYAASCTIDDNSFETGD
ncbi:MAG: hypothetical protein IT449_01940, partial [Phycisphaerales bacterium]|nr:hypothetical protein [Phycisphaerales bacterium]